MADARLPPVALFVFNRPDLTALAVKRLAAVRPATLLVVADGPRDADESYIVAQTLAAVRGGIDWDADVRWCISDTNLGCSQRLNSGLDWVFEQVEAAVILEDDIEVDDRFFGLAAQGLQRYRGDAGVAGICARNELASFAPDGAAFLARRGGVWGWATWADRWRDYRRRFDAEQDLLAARLPHHESPVLARLHAHFLARREWQTSGVWDIAWSMWSLAEGRCFLLPPTNMSVNHGFRPDGTHTAVGHDLRGELPLGLAAEAGPLDPVLRGPEGQNLADRYDELATLLDIATLCAQPRRWRMMARHASRHPGEAAAASEAVQIMLQPWQRPEEMRAVLAHLGRHLSSPHLDELAAAFA